MGKLGKLSEKKRLKMESLLNTSFDLFITKGISKTSVADIAEKAGVAKGTFYLYFKDKYDIKNRLIRHKSGQLFMNAFEAMQKAGIKTIDDQIVFIVDNIVDDLERDRALLNFIHKDLSWGMFEDAIASDYSTSDNDMNINLMYREMIKESGIKLTNPDLMLFTIVELVSSCAYSVITSDSPLPIAEFKPHLYETIRGIIKQYMVNE